MRPALILTVLLAASLEAQPAGVEGVVMDKSTGQPLRGVHVRMLTGDFGGQGGINTVYGATSDAAGRFSADNMKPGFYLVLAERTGFVQAPSSPTLPVAFGTLTLKAGQHLTDYKVDMTPRALIAGRVVDEYGDPVEKVSVVVEPVPPARPQENPFGRSSATTDDRGEFRLLTAPGKYYLRTWVNQNGGLAEIRTDGTSGAPFVATYYPSAANTAAASVVQVAAGQDLAGIEIRLTRSAAGAAGRGFTISGIVTGTPENARASVMLRFGETAGQLNNSRPTTAAPDGKFTFTGMQPGFYSVLALYASGKTFLQSRTVEFHLAASDETNLQLILAPGEELTGTLEIVGDAPPGGSEKHTVRLEAADRFNPLGQAEPHAAEVGKDGSFRIANIPPGKFRAVVDPMPENAYVKEVTLDSKPAPDGVLDLSQGAGGSRVKVTVSRGGGQISGRILGKDGEPAAGSMVMVFLEAGPKKLMEEENIVRASDGKYSFKGIRPGKYRLFALDVVELVSVLDDGSEGEVKPFFEAAEEIEIAEGGRISKDITAFTKVPEKKEANVPHQ